MSREGAGARQPGRIRVWYRLTCAEDEDPATKASDIALEQTVELPYDCVSAEVQETVVGQVEEARRVAGNVWQAVISYSPETVGGNVAQLLNLLFGNTSLKSGVLLTDVELPEVLLDRLPGPGFGIEGLRSLCHVSESHPMSCTALKPLGMTADQLADLCHQFARGGIDIIKDDHGLANQDTAPFRERVRRCQDAVRRGNDETGGNSVYFPHLTSSRSELEEDLSLLRALEIKGALVCPLLIGLGTMAGLAAESGLVLLAHPSLAGAYFHADHGIVPELLLGKLFRLLGSDGVIYPNVGGRFALDQATCSATNEALRAAWSEIKPAFPVPAGGIDLDKVPYWIDRYGKDTIFLLGGSLYRQRDLFHGAKRLVQALKRG